MTTTTFESEIRDAHRRFSRPATLAVAAISKLGAWARSLPDDDLLCLEADAYRRALNDAGMPTHDARRTDEARTTAVALTLERVRRQRACARERRGA